MTKLTQVHPLKTDRPPPYSFAIQKLFVRAMFAWPEDCDKYPLVRKIGALYQVPNWFSFLGVVWNILIDPKPGGAVDYMQTFADGIGFATLLIKGYYIYSRREQIAILTELVHDFEDIESELGIRAVRRKRPKGPWIPTYLFVLQTAASLTVVFTNAVNANGEERVSSVPTPGIVLRTDALYYPWVAIFVIAHGTNWFTYAAVDGIYSCFTHLIQDKAETLKVAIRTLGECQDEELDKKLPNLIRYHQLIIQLHKGTERLCTGPNFGLVVHIIISLGSLIIRLVFIGLSPGHAAFALVYAVWIVCQLVIFCFLGEAVAQSGMDIARESYKIYRPTMSPNAVRALLFVILRGQRPLKLTAMGLVVLNRTTFLDILRKCYSGFSALSRLKGI